MVAKKTTGTKSKEGETLRFVEYMKSKGVEFPYTTTVYEDNGNKVRVTLEQQGKKVGTKTPWKV
jgi:hypothetical protein